MTQGMSKTFRCWKRGKDRSHRPAEAASLACALTSAIAADIGLLISGAVHRAAVIIPGFSLKPLNHHNGNRK